MLRNFSVKIFAAAALFAVLLAAVSAQDQDKWTGYVEFSAKPGSDRSLAKGDLFLPIQQNEDSLLFVNLKTNFDDHSYKEGNVGIGSRKIYDNWLVGGWAYYDWKESTTGNTFDQMTIGGEFLSNEWDIRANAYVSEKKKKDSDRASIVELNGNQIQARLGEERALSGVDFEIGKKLPFFEDSRFFVGGYHYDANGFEKVSGPKLRLEMRFHDLPIFSSFSQGSRLTLGAEYTEDSVRGSESFALLQLKIPFGEKNKIKKTFLSSLEKRMVETVKRDDDIVTSERQGDTLMSLFNPKTGQIINTVETVNASTANVASTVANAGRNSLIIADGSEGVIDVGGSTINTSPGQIIAGGGQSITLQAQKPNGSLINMDYTPAGQRGSISRTGSGELIYVNNDDDVTITGVDLSGGRPLRVNNSQNVCVLNTNVLNSAANRQGIYVQNNSSVNFENNDIANTGRQGLLITSGSRATINYLDVSDTAFEGVYFSGNTSANLRNIDISNTGREGLRIRSGSNVSANNVTITKSGSEAIELHNSELNLSNASITDIDVNANRDGIYAYGGSTLNINNIVIDNVTSQGIITNNTMSTILDATIRNTGHQGIYVYGNSDMDLENVNITNSGSQGIYSRDAILNAKNLNVSTSARHGVYLYRTIADFDNANISDSVFQGLYVNRGAFNFNDIDIQNSGRDGAIATNAAFNGSNLSIRNSSGRGLYLNNTSSMLDNALVDSTTSQGVLLRNSNATINNLQIHNSGTQGVYAYNGSVANIAILDIYDAGRQGIYARGVTLNASDVDIFNANNQGAYLHSTTANINGIRVYNAGQQGIYLRNNSNAVISNANISSPNREGLYVRDSDLNISNASISNITASANRDGIFIYRDSNVTLNSVSVSNVTGDGLQVHGTNTLQPTVIAYDFSLANSGRYGVITTRGNVTLNNANISASVLDSILVNRGDLVVNTASVTNSGRFGVYALRSNAVLRDLTVANTARDGVLLNLSTVSLDNSTIRDIGDGDSSDDAIQIINSTISGDGNNIEGSINSGVACRSGGTNIGSIGFSSGLISSCP